MFAGVRLQSIGAACHSPAPTGRWAMHSTASRAGKPTGGASGGRGGGGSLAGAGAGAGAGRGGGVASAPELSLPFVTADKGGDVIVRVHVTPGCVAALAVAALTVAVVTALSLPLLPPPLLSLLPPPLLPLLPPPLLPLLPPPLLLLMLLVEPVLAGLLASTFKNPCLLCRVGRAAALLLPLRADRILHMGSCAPAVCLRPCGWHPQGQANVHDHIRR